MKVLHIANWYPNPSEPKEALFIREHIDALQPYCSNKVWHLDIKDHTSFFKIGYYNNSQYEEGILIHTSISIWAFREVLFLFLLGYVFLRERLKGQHYDLINFHIAYPLCTYLKFYKKLFKIPFVVTEHWTAYHFNFNLPKITDKLGRIKNIFIENPEVPIITVSKALSQDIKDFTNCQNIKSYVVPNVVRSDIFFYNPSIEIEHNTFFMVNYWRAIKKPLVILQSFKEYLEYEKGILNIGGYGPLWQEMQSFVSANNMTAHVNFIGKMDKIQIAAEMRKATAFIHASSYETFSVVCAEALMCGTPVIVTELPAVCEFISLDNGIVVSNEKDWCQMLMKISTERDYYNRENIAKKAALKFSQKAVGDKYWNFLSEVSNRYFEKDSSFSEAAYQKD